MADNVGPWHVAGTWQCKTLAAMMTGGGGGVAEGRRPTGGWGAPSPAPTPSPVLAAFSDPTSDTPLSSQSRRVTPLPHHPSGPQAPGSTSPPCLSLHHRSAGAKPQPGEGRLSTEGRKPHSCLSGLALCSSDRTTCNRLTFPAHPLSRPLATSHLLLPVQPPHPSAPLRKRSRPEGTHTDVPGQV